MSDLVAFLRARVDEDEAAAKAAAAQSAEDDTRWWFDDATPETPREFHVARHDPARVLREVEAKRRHLDQYRMASHACQIARPDEANSLAGYRDATYGTLRADAAVYRDHPGYDPDWTV